MAKKRSQTSPHDANFGTRIESPRFGLRHSSVPIGSVFIPVSEVHDLGRLYQITATIKPDGKAAVVWKLRKDR